MVVFACRVKLGMIDYDESEIVVVGEAEREAEAEASREASSSHVWRAALRDVCGMRGT